MRGDRRSKHGKHSGRSMHTQQTRQAQRAQHAYSLSTRLFDGTSNSQLAGADGRAAAAPGVGDTLMRGGDATPALEAVDASTNGGGANLVPTNGDTPTDGDVPAAPVVHPPVTSPGEMTTTTTITAAAATTAVCMCVRVHVHACTQWANGRST